MSARQILLRGATGGSLQEHATSSTALSRTDQGTSDVDSGRSRAAMNLQELSDIDFDNIYQECLEAQNLLVVAINKYLAKVKQPPLIIEAKPNWATVQQSLEKACMTLDKAAARDKDVSGFTGKLKKGFHGLCRNAGAGKLFTALIPNDSFGSTLCGGLNIVFAALEQTGYHREAVYKALVQLPQIVDNFDEYIEMVPNDSELHRRTARLYSEVCLTLEHIMRWFTSNSFVVGASRLLNPVRFTAKLNDRMAEVKLAAEDFKTYASKLMFKRQEDLLRMQASSSHDQQIMARYVREIDRNMQWLVERAKVFDGMQTEVLDRLQPFLQGNMKRLVSRNSPAPSEVGVPTLPAASTATVDTILGALLYDKNLRKKDVQSILDLGIYTSPSRPDPARVEAIQRNAQIRAWLTLDASAALLLNGGVDPFCTSTSFSVAMIVSSLLHDHSRPLRSTTESPAAIVVLAYFCDRHRDYRRDAAGSPTEMAMSLMLQLLDRYRMFNSGDIEACLDGTDPDDLASIVNSLGRLISCLPSNAVVLLFVDGLYFFTTPADRLSETIYVVEQLLGMFRSEHSATLKLLFSSPVASRFIEEHFEDDEVVNMSVMLPTLRDDSILVS